MACSHGCCPTNRDHWLSVGIGGSAIPSRRGAVAATATAEKALDRDLDAYQRLRHDGLQPKRIDGSAAVEKVATERHHVEGGVPCS